MIADPTTVVVIGPETVRLPHHRLTLDFWSNKQELRGDEKSFFFWLLWMLNCVHTG